MYYIQDLQLFKTFKEKPGVKHLWFIFKDNIFLGIRMINTNIEKRLLTIISYQYNEEVKGFIEDVQFEDIFETDLTEKDINDNMEMFEHNITREGYQYVRIL